jgi:cytochrome c553
MKIVLSAVVALFLLGCSDNKSDSHQAQKELKASAVEKEVVVAVKQPAKEETIVVKEEAVPTKQEVVEEVAAVTQEVVPEEKKIVSPAKKESVAPQIDAAKLYVACSSCHGAHGEKKALGKSQTIGGWDVAKVEKALQGYKDGTYGGAMKAIMKGQASKLNDAQIKALAEHISKL